MSDYDMQCIVHHLCDRAIRLTNLVKKPITNIKSLRELSIHPSIRPS